MDENNRPTRKRDTVTVSFGVAPEMYDRLIKRLPNYGERTLFFRTVIERFLNGKLELIMEKKF